MKQTHVFLVPGFFGFANFGKFAYFAHVAAAIREILEEYETIGHIHQVPTLPTSSIPLRTQRLSETLERVAGEDEHPIHLIGHSTGGLDIRLLLEPNANIPGEPLPASIKERIAVAVSVSCPHRGTPLADIFTSVMGRRLLKLLSATTLQSIRLGTVPAPVMILLAEALFNSSNVLGLRSKLLERTVNLVLKSFDDDKRKRIVEFLAWVEEDQSLLAQLAPPSMEIFNAGIPQLKGIRHGCVVTRTPTPALRTSFSIGVSPKRQAAYAVFRSLHKLTGNMPTSELWSLGDAQQKSLIEQYGDLPNEDDNDAIVPTLSQPWGEIIHATWADHLDVIGHFDAPRRNPAHTDWLFSGSGFSREEFLKTWRKVVEYAVS